MSGTASPARLESLLAQRAWLQRLARALVLDESRADDLEQEVWLQALRGAEPRSPRAWLATVLRRAASRMRRGERRRTANEGAALPPADPPGPEEITARAEAVERVAREVRELEEPYRTAIYLRYFEDLAPAAVATRLGVPLETVRSRLRRALATLRRRLDGSRPGGRASWVALLAPMSAAPRSPDVVSAGSVLGGALVTKSAVAAIAAGLLLVGALLLQGRVDPSSSRARETASADASRPVLATGTPTPETTVPEGSAPVRGESPRRAGEPQSDAHARILALLARLKGDVVEAVGVSRELSALDPDLVFEVLAAGWGGIASAIDRKRVLDWLVKPENPRVLDLLELQFRDPDPEVHAWGAGAVVPYSGIDFRGDLAGYERWRTQIRGKSVAEILRATTTMLSERVRAVAPLERKRFTQTLEGHLRARKDDLAGAEVLLPELEPWFTDHWAIDDLGSLFEVVQRLRPDEAYLRRTVLPLLDADRADAWLATFWLGQMKCRWAVDLLLSRLREQVRDTNPPRWGADPVYVTSQALGILGDTRAVPGMIEVLREAEGTDDVARISPNLARLAGVKWSKEMDAAWWRGWWEENGTRLSSSGGAEPR